MSLTSRRTTVSCHTLKVGEPAFPDGPPLTLEGARLLLDGPLIRLLIVYFEPTAEEVRAVESGDVELGIYHENGVAAVVARVGEHGEHWLIEARAPLILLDVDAHIDGVGGDGAPAAPPELYPAELALCGTQRGIVHAVRQILVPVELVHAARRAAHAQAARFESVAAAIRAHECGLRGRTVRAMMDAAAVRARIAA